MVRSKLKRIFDIIVSLLGLVVLSPLLFLLALSVRLSLGLPVLFVQERSGLNGRPFQIVKFRSMVEVVDENGDILPDSHRTTKFGEWLRSSSLDELPELWNVLKGEMSIVGPRPLFTDYLALYSEEHGRRHEVLPGITGLAQINGRNLISWEQKFDYDVWYVDNRSFWLDLRIIFMTLQKVVLREGITAQDETTTRFKGYR